MSPAEQAEEPQAVSHDEAAEAEADAILQKQLLS